MNDRDLTDILPSWGTFSASKRDKIFRDYQRESIVDEATPQWQQLEKRTSVFVRERFLSLVGPYLDQQNYIGIMRLMDPATSIEEYMEYSLKIREDSDQANQFILQLWERCGPALIGSLDARNSMLAMQTAMLLESILPKVGRAATAIQKSRKFPSWYRWCLTNDNNNNRSSGEDINVMTVVPMQHQLIQVGISLMHSCPLRFYRDMRDDGAIRATIDVFAQSSDVELQKVAAASMERLLLAAYNLNIVEEDIELFRRAQTAASVCLLKLNGPVNPPLEISHLIGMVADLLRKLAIVCKLPVSPGVSRSVEDFGDLYTDREPRGVLERERWSDRYAAQRLKEDWTDPEYEDVGREYLRAMSQVFEAQEMERRALLQCAHCRTPEVMPNNITEERLLKKCTRCRLVYYCDVKCQKADWPTHRKVCKKPQRESLPESLRSFEENVARAHAVGTAGGNTAYPFLFAVWLDNKYNSKS